MFDQDCFLDVRLLAAKRIRDEWINEHLQKLARVSEEEFTARKDIFVQNNANIQLILDISNTDREMMNKLKVKNLVFLGSMLDGLYLEKGFPVFDNDKSGVNATDLDILIEYEGLKILDYNNVVCSTETHLHLEETSNPGYFKLRICYPSVIYERQPAYLKAIKLKHKLAVDLEKSNFVFVGHQTFENYKGASLGGVIDDELGVIELDLVAALTIKQWPEVAKSFIARPRLYGWPPRNILKTITDKGCGLVAKSHRESLKSDYEWRISFACSEQILVRSLSNHHIRAYLFLKSIFKQYLEETDGLSTYMMKNVLFWTLENTDQNKWRESNIYFCIDALFNTLCICLENGLLNSYFLPSLNLISHLAPKTVHSLAGKIRVIRRNLLSVIVDCTGTPNFKGICDISLSNLLNFSTQELDLVLSMAYFSIYLHLRLQVMRYQLKLGLRTLTYSFKRQCKSICNKIAPRAVWYLLESIKLQPDSSLYAIDLDYDGELVLDIQGMRSEVINFWRCPLYQELFKNVIQDQETVLNGCVTEIPEFDEFVSWVDMTCQWSGGNPITLNKSSITEYPHVKLD